MPKIFNFFDQREATQYSLGMDGRFRLSLDSAEWPSVFGVNGGIDGDIRVWLTAEFGKGMNLMEKPKSRAKQRVRQWGFYENGYRHYVLFRRPEMGFAFKLRWS
jgi:hypothetical protein